MSILDRIASSYQAYGSYLWNEISHPSWHNYFYWLIGVSIFAWSLEYFIPWRTKQPIVRKDFWLDFFYMFFNFFLFSLIAYSALSDIAVYYFNSLLHSFGMENIVAIKLHTLPVWTQLLLMFVIRDFIQWNVHRLLHYSPTLWEFHKVHHSVEQMGFAAHLRYHFMENIVYRAIEYIPLAMLGFGITDFFIIHIFALGIGHLNHSNIYLPLGPLKYLFNSPQMHIWHHAEHLPKGSSGVNYGLSLSLWDYIFGTVYMPHNGRDEKLGFEKVESYPSGFFSQAIFPFKEIWNRITK